MGESSNQVQGTIQEESWFRNLATSRRKAVANKWRTYLPPSLLGMEVSFPHAILDPLSLSARLWNLGVFQWKTDKRPHYRCLRLEWQSLTVTLLIVSKGVTLTAADCTYFLIRFWNMLMDQIFFYHCWFPVQGDTSGCSLGWVDIRTEVEF